MTETETVNVLPHLNELKDTWRRQDFKLSKQQQEEYNLLVQARRERVRYFYEAGLVHKPSAKKVEE